MGCVSLVMGVIAPRLFLLVGWTNDQAYWNGLFGSAAWLGLGWLVLPWTTLMYGLVAANGMSFLNWIFIILAVALDLGTWGVGVLGGRKEVSNYRGT